MKLSAKHAYRNWHMRDIADKEYLRPDHSAVREYVVLILVLVALVFLGMHP